MCYCGNDDSLGFCYSGVCQNARSKLTEMIEAPAPIPPRADPGRPLVVGEVIEAGDEAWSDGIGPWARVSDARIGEKYQPWNGDSGMHVAMRRAFQPPHAGGRDLAWTQIRKALESALAGVWDGHYGKGVTVGYAQAVDAEVKAALKALDGSAKGLPGADAPSEGK